MIKAPCARCGADIECWPFRAGKAVCPECLHVIRVENGRRVGAGQRPEIGAVKERAFRGSRYRLVFRPDHPRTTKRGWMMEHRLVMEAKIGRLLTRAEVVHHIDHNTLNNSPCNLKLYPSKGAHLAAEHSADGVDARTAGYPTCERCGKRAAYGETVCWSCWKQSQTCPTCGRPDRKMARRDMCHGCYKRLRVSEGRYHRRPVSGVSSQPNNDG